MRTYHGEKAIISLTSWKARINTVGITIFSLFRSCPGFHIVLVLSEEEFPKKEAELPKDLQIMTHRGICEILWVYKNVRSFKKILYTMDVYRNVPVISADDDCIYYSNYAEILYASWLKQKDAVHTLGLGANGNEKENMLPWPTGSKSLYPPFCFGDYWKPYVEDIAKVTNDDDTFYSYMINLVFHRKIVSPHPGLQVYVFHDETSPLHGDKKRYGYHNAFAHICRICGSRG